VGWVPSTLPKNALSDQKFPQSPTTPK